MQTRLCRQSDAVTEVDVPHQTGHEMEAAEHEKATEQQHENERVRQDRQVTHQHHASSVAIDPTRASPARDDARTLDASPSYQLRVNVVLATLTRN